MLRGTGTDELQRLQQLAGGTYQQVQTYWREDHERVKAFLSTWTPLGYINLDGRIYMVRNLLDNTYYPFGR